MSKTSNKHSEERRPVTVAAQIRRSLVSPEDRRFRRRLLRSLTGKLVGR